MPQFIVRTLAHTKDGSQLGGGILMVTTPSAEAAKIQGANDLGVPVSSVTAERMPE